MVDVRLAILLAAVAAFLLFGCAGQPSSQGGMNCTSYAVDKCPLDSCAVCPPCEACSSISCNTIEYCQGIGFNQSWWEEVRPKNP